MLRKTRGDAVIKLIDFGCSEVLSHPEEKGTGIRLPSRTLTHEEGATTAYCPPEAFEDAHVDLDPSVDMWALGVIVYMMLLGRHPFDQDCDASDEEIARRIKEQRQPPLHECPYASNLSPSALDLIGKLMEPDPAKRMTAHDMLHHPWVTGETASEYVLEGSAERLEQLQRYRSGIEKSVIEKLLSFSADDQTSVENNNDKQMSLLERAFDHLDKDKKGFLSKADLKALPTTRLRRMKTNKAATEDLHMSFNHFSDLVGQSMRSVHFKKGQVVYNENDEGDYMYFINSGTIEVSTKDGFKTKKGQGDHFGKGGILGRKRRTTITCTTPVNALRIDKDFFARYIVKGSPLATKLREKGNNEKFDRAMFIMERDGEMTEATYKKGDIIFREGDVPRDAYIVKQGLIDITCAEHHMYPSKPGRIFGIQSQILKRNRKATASCTSDECVIRTMPLERLEKLAERYPVLQSTLSELALRQEFRRAVVLRRMKSFPNKEQLKEAFDDIDTDRSGTLDAKELRTLMQSLGAAFSDGEIATLIKTLDINESGEVDFHEFEHVFSQN
jgi:CRP-like cAMP-binding protein